MTKQVADEFKIDIDIEKNIEGFVITLYMDYILIGGPVKKMIASLFYLSDDVLINRPEQSSEYMLYGFYF